MWWATVISSKDNPRQKNMSTSNLPKPVTLQNLLQEQSRDLYDAENSYSGYLSRMIDTSSDSELIHELQHIAHNTRQNISDMGSICSLLGVPPTGVKCEAMHGLLREVKETTVEYESGAVKDAALIANAQRIAHYEIAGFGTAKAFARHLDLKDIVEIFADLLERASFANNKLTKIATGSWFTGGINDLAAQGG